MNTFSLPKTQHLVVFQEVIRSGSIGAGAKALGLTQPAVSKIIGDMESYFWQRINRPAKYWRPIHRGRAGISQPVRSDHP